MRRPRGRVVTPPVPTLPPAQLPLLLDPAPKPHALGSTSLPRARRTDRATSHLATVQAARGLTDKQLAVLTVLRSIGSTTDEWLVRRYREMQHGQLVGVYPRELPDLTDSSIRTRRSELVTLELVRDSGREGRTERGGKATVWELTGAGAGLSLHVE